MQVVDSKFVGYWKHQFWASLSWESMEFSAFLILAVWTASITYLTSGKGELQTTNYFLSLYLYFSACYLISHPSLLSIYFFIYTYIYIFFFFCWFATVDALSSKHFVMTKPKTWAWNQPTWFLKDGTAVLWTWFLDFEWYSKKVFYYKGHIGNLQKFVVTKYAKNCYGENCFIQNHFNPNA